MNGKTILLGAAGLGWCLLPAGPAGAYTAAGDRTFPATLVLPQAAPSDEIYVNPETQPLADGRASDFTVTYDKTITDRLGIEIENTYTRLDRNGASSLSGWQNVDTAIKYLAILDPPHEFLLTVGVDREFGDTGALRVGADRSGATEPAAYFAKGLGDLDLGYLRPLAVTGIVGYQVADQTPRPNLVEAGFAVEYSVPYLESKVAAVALPDFIRGMTPITEVFFTTPTGNGYGTATAGIIAPGVSYAGEGWEFGIEALIPATRGAGSGVGVTAQLHLSLDYLFPDSIGKPLFSEQ